jgi:hypothetical protein
MELPSSPAAARAAFLSALGCIYLCAFASFWVQYDGLLGTADGLLPVNALVHRELQQLQQGDGNPELNHSAWQLAWQMWRRKPLLAWFAPAWGGLPLDAGGTFFSFQWCAFASVGVCVGSRPRTPPKELPR